MRKLLFLIILALTPALFAAENDIIGKWFTGSGTIEITKNANGKFEGQLIDLKYKFYTEGPNSGKERMDGWNPDPKLQTRKLIGIHPLKDFSYDKTNDDYENGTIYNPEDGKTYSCKLKIQKDGTLNVRGYVLIPLFGKTQIWKRIK